MRTALPVLAFILACAAGAASAQDAARPAPVLPSLDGCTYERCMPRLATRLGRLVLGAPDSAVALSPVAGDSLLGRTRGTWSPLRRRDEQGALARARARLGMGFVLGGLAVAGVAAAAGDGDAAAFALLGGGVAGSLASVSGVRFTRAATEAWEEAVAHHRDTLATWLLARRGRGVDDAASSLPALAGCSWSRCRLAVRSSAVGSRLAVGGMEEPLGITGGALVERVAAVPAAVPYARRAVTSRRLAALLGVASLVTSFATVSGGDAFVVVGSSSLLAGSVVFAARAQRAAEAAVWVYNRELLR